MRLHGPESADAGRYDARALGQWAKRLRGWRAEGRDAHLRFDNDQAGDAAGDAARLRARLARA